MTAALVVEAPGLAVTVQDRGRRGARAAGVAVSGWLDAERAACALRLAGAAPDAAGLEIGLLGPTLRLDGPRLRLALVGDVAARIRRADGSEDPFAPWTSQVLRDGDRLTVAAPRRGPAVLAVAGGLLTPPQLAARATHLRTGLGGLGGRALAAGDRLPVAASAAADDLRLAAPLAEVEGPIRVVLGPQDDRFDPAAVAAFAATEWTLGRDADRMGLRLDGPPLAHRGGADIVSDAVVPGSIQVPGDGRPIVLLADAQTVGGYAKIATVIAADLPRLARLVPGDRLRFAPVDLAAAALARAERAAAFAAWAAGIVARPPPCRIDAAALLCDNLVGGVVDARDPPEEDRP